MFHNMNLSLIFIVAYGIGSSNKLWSVDWKKYKTISI